MDFGPAWLSLPSARGRAHPAPHRDERRARTTAGGSASPSTGPPGGTPVLWFHGTPGGRRQIPESLRQLGCARDVRLVVVERPGYGGSTPHAYPSIARGHATTSRCSSTHSRSTASGSRRSRAVGPTPLRARTRSPTASWPPRSWAASRPTSVPTRLRGGLVRVLAPLGPRRRAARPTGGHCVPGPRRRVRPLGDDGVDIVARLFPAGDRVVFAEPENKVMFVDDIVRTGARRAAGPGPGPARLRPRLGLPRSATSRVPVHFWHGDADPIVTLEQARHMAEQVPRATFVLRPDESHLGGFAAADEAVARGHAPTGRTPP